MEEQIKIDTEYLKSYNLGYELAKELNLKSPMFENSSLNTSSMNAMQSGMKQFGVEQTLNSENKMNQSSPIKVHLEGNDNQDSLNGNNKKNDSGLDVSL